MVLPSLWRIVPAKRCWGFERAKLDSHWMPASPNILFFFELLTGKTGESWVFFFLLPISGDTKTHKPSWVDLLDSQKFRSESELLSRVAVPFLD